MVIVNVFYDSDENAVLLVILAIVVLVNSTSCVLLRKSPRRLFWVVDSTPLFHCIQEFFSASDEVASDFHDM